MTTIAAAIDIARKVDPRKASPAAEKKTAAVDIEVAELPMSAGIAATVVWSQNLGTAAEAVEGVRLPNQSHVAPRKSTEVRGHLGHRTLPPRAPQVDLERFLLP